MEHEEKPLSEHESLLIIQQMINTAKHEQKDDGKGWIIWGWMLFAATAGTLLNNYFQWFNPFFFWNAFGIVAICLGIFAAGRAIFFTKTKKVKTYTNEIFEKLNAGFFISLFFIIVALNVGISPLKGFPLLMSLYGFWILIYGALLNFKPSVFGAYIMWALAFVALFIPAIFSAQTNNCHFTWVMILHAIGVLCGYIIPGHLANRAFNKLKGKEII